MTESAQTPKPTGDPQPAQTGKPGAGVKMVATRAFNTVTVAALRPARDYGEGAIRRDTGVPEQTFTVTDRSTQALEASLMDSPNNSASRILLVRFQHLGTGAPSAYAERVPLNLRMANPQVIKFGVDEVTFEGFVLDEDEGVFTATRITLGHLTPKPGPQPAAQADLSGVVALDLNDTRALDKVARLLGEQLPSPNGRAGQLRNALRIASGMQPRAADSFDPDSYAERRRVLAAQAAQPEEETFPQATNSYSCKKCQGGDHLGCTGDWVGMTDRIACACRQAAPEAHAHLDAEAKRETLARVIYAAGPHADDEQWLMTTDGSPNTAAYAIADAVMLARLSR